MKKEIIFEDNHLFIVNKPAGLLVHGDDTGDFTLLDKGKAYLKEKYQKPGNVFLQPAHRLDRPVSGTLVMARTSKAITRLTKLFRTNQVQKEYWAITDACAELTTGIVKDLPLFKNRKQNIVRVVDRTGDAKLATTSYELVATSGRYFLWKLLPLTGRSHQLRVTLKHLGMPIVGDLKYGASLGLGNRIALHCARMSFIHPVQKDPLAARSLPELDAPWDHFVDYFSNL